MEALINIWEAARLLGFKDLRSIRKWCHRRSVAILHEVGSNGQYLIRVQFNYARLKPLIPVLQALFKDRWPDALQACIDNNIVRMIELEERFKTNLVFGKKQHRAIGQHEQKFLSTLTKQIHEL